jgi:hypothetical protein
MRRIVISVGLMLAVVSTSASDVTVFGAGTQSCGAFLAVDSSDRVGYMAWAAGYLTGVNDVKNRQVTIDMDGVMGWLHNYCEAHPLDSYFVALDTLAHVLDHYVLKGNTP